MATAAERIIAVARSQIGVEERPPGSNCGPRPYLKCHAWCGEFEIWVYATAGVDDGGLCSPATAGIVQAAAREGRLRAEPVPGALVVWNPGEHGHTELFICWRDKARRIARTIGGNTGDEVKEHDRPVDGAYFCVPKSLEAPPVFRSVYWWEDPAAEPDRHELRNATPQGHARREQDIDEWVAEHGNPGHVRRGTAIVKRHGKGVPLLTWWTGPRKRSIDFAGKTPAYPTDARAESARDRNRKKVAAERPGHILRPRSRRERVS